MIRQATPLGILTKMSFEALVLEAYPDDSKRKHLPVAEQRHSVGFGSQRPEVVPGFRLTREQAFAWVQSDIESREAIINRQLDKHGIVLQKPHEFDALLILFYQAGTDNLENVLKVISKPRTPKVWLAEVAHTWIDQDKNAADEDLDGLLLRRIAELNIFARGKYGDQGGAFEIPMWDNKPTSRIPDRKITITSADLPWRQ
jgi:GH24 family phage-related lysozyme (muramidase)